MAIDRRLRPGALSWTRFDRYVVDNGVVRPAAGAQSEHFDPWDSYQPLAKTAAASPYQTLGALCSELRWRNGADDEPELDGPSEHRLLAWCRENGLLGILLEDLESVEFPARWEPDARPAARRELLPTVRSYHHDGSGWREAIRQSPPNLRRVIERTPERVRGELVVANLDGWNTPGVHLRDADGGRVAVLSVEDVQLRPFFLTDHTLADSAVEPASPAFWKSYGEPVPLFVRRARAIGIALEALGAGDPSPLNGLASHNCQAIVVDGGRKLPRWTSRSLLGAMVAMAMQDLVGGGRVVLCAACHSAFVSSAYQARYCSSQCRNRTTQRIHRERVKRTQSTKEHGDE